ncbi:PREDICTED: transcriptional corepressor LEUNIG_HOMOLOG-like isoform X1 [Camelina sativa]|uniref:Transcriptional corepressor LEUNIG_HOMOLOG-like isoform X1 n=1 Tax=Camelina sativa TaxID=90675 RepID=A0ABM0U4W6_CAMSA|nr:PREDICTED: transcriptional corepressor LEUNIG_HOMOLOG-like isoform X1 [Camelina sativa]
MYEERMKQPNPMNSETSQPHLDARTALLKSATNHHGQMDQGNHQGGVSAALQQIQSRTQQPTGIRSEVNLGTSRRQLPVDPSTVYDQGILQSKPGLNPGVSGLPLKGWPLTGIEQIRPGLGGPQVQKSFLQNQSQFQLSPQQQQQQISASSRVFWIDSGKKLLQSVLFLPPRNSDFESKPLRLVSASSRFYFGDIVPSKIVNCWEW